MSSVKKYGGTVEVFLKYHQFMDATKGQLCDFRHRALRHHAEGIALMIEVLGPTITLPNGKEIPTRWVGQDHVKEDLGFVPTAADWLRCIQAQPWMNRSQKLTRELEITASEEEAK